MYACFGIAGYVSPSVPSVPSVLSNFALRSFRISEIASPANAAPFFAVRQKELAVLIFCP